MKRLQLGSKQTPMEVDLPKLMDSKMLVQSASGGGKSWLLRVLAEQAMTDVPVVIIDREGEFSTLREKFDVVLVSDDGDLRPSVKASGLLARRLVETHVSAVVDVSELKPLPRLEFVRNFLTSLLDLPKSLRSPLMLMLDEAHQFCPEGWSSDDVAAEAVVNIVDAGRKRGICAVVATQRLSKLDKSVANECRNKFIGYTDPSDIDRVVKVLGVRKEDAEPMTVCDAGNWWARGPALSSRETMHFISAAPVTTHPRPGQQLAPPRKPSAFIKQAMKELESIEADAEQEVTSIEQAQVIIAGLRQELEMAAATPPPAPADPMLVQREVALAEQEIVRHYAGVVQSHIEAITRRVTGVQASLANAREAMKPVDANLDEIIVATENLLRQMRPSSGAAAPTAALPNPAPNPSAGGPADTPADAVAIDITPSLQKVINSLAWWAKIGMHTPHRQAVAIMAGYTVNGNFNNMLGCLRTAGLIAYPGSGTVQLTQLGAAKAHKPAVGHLLSDVHNAWRSKLTPSEWKVLEVVISAHPKPLNKEQVAAGAGYTVNGNFNNILGRLRTLGAITPRGEIQATRLVFPQSLSAAPGVEVS